MTRETLNQEASDAAESLVVAIHEGARVGAGDGWDVVTYERAVVAAHRGLVSLEGTEDERAAKAKARATALRAAVLASYHEEGFSDCDHCGSLAVYQWTRTAKQLKSMAGPKIKGNRTQARPVSWRCVTHVPSAFPELGENYRDARVHVQAAA